MSANLSEKNIIDKLKNIQIYSANDNDSELYFQIMELIVPYINKRLYQLCQDMPKSNTQRDMRLVEITNPINNTQRYILIQKIRDEIEDVINTISIDKYSEYNDIKHKYFTEKIPSIMNTIFNFYNSYITSGMIHCDKIEKKF